MVMTYLLKIVAEESYMLKHFYTWGKDTSRREIKEM